MSMRTLIQVAEQAALPFLGEAPLADLTVHGSPLDQDGSFSPSDRAFMRKAIEKKLYLRRLGKFPAALYVYVLNQAGLEQYGRILPEGEFDHKLINSIKVKHPELSEFITQVSDAVDAGIQRDPGGIHFVIGDNVSDEQMPPSPWILVHRLVHAMTTTAGSPQWRLIDTKHKLRSIGLRAHHILTMRSATQGRLIPSETEIEMATQYLLTGNIPLRLDRPEIDEPFKAEIEETIKQFKQGVDRMVGSCIGKAFYI